MHLIRSIFPVLAALAVGVVTLSAPPPAAAQRIPTRAVALLAEPGVRTVLVRGGAPATGHVVGRRGLGRGVRLGLRASPETIDNVPSWTLTPGGTLVGATTSEQKVRAPEPEDRLDEGCCERVIVSRWHPGRRAARPRVISPPDGNAGGQLARSIRMASPSPGRTFVAYAFEPDPRSGGSGAAGVRVALVTSGGVQALSLPAGEGAELVDLSTVGSNAVLTLSRASAERATLEQVFIGSDGRAGPAVRIAEGDASVLRGARVAIAADGRMLVATNPQQTAVLARGTVGEPLTEAVTVAGRVSGLSFAEGFIDLPPVGRGVFAFERVEDVPGAGLALATPQGIVRRDPSTLARTVDPPQFVFGRNGSALVAFTARRAGLSGVEAARMRPDGTLGRPRTVVAERGRGRSCLLDALAARPGGGAVAAVTCLRAGRGQRFDSAFRHRVVRIR